jgi:hypothetical protein
VSVCILALLSDMQIISLMGQNMSSMCPVWLYHVLHYLIIYAIWGGGDVIERKICFDFFYNF